MNESIGNVMKSGFPMLLLVILGMLLVTIWRQEHKSNAQKWQWTAVLMIPSLVSLLVVAALGTDHIELLGGVVTGRQPFLPPWNQAVYQGTTFTLFFLPFSGVLAWLLLDR